MFDFKKTYNKAPKGPRKNPRVSVNKLAEYVYATSVRRKSIITDSKYPKDFMVLQYTDARNATKDYFRTGDKESIISMIDDIGKRVPENDQEKTHFLNSIDLLKIVGEIPLDQFGAYQFLNESIGDGHIHIAGLDISVVPDLYMVADKKEGGAYGAIKLSLTKGGLSKDQQSIVALLIERYLSGHIAEPSIVSPAACISFDGFSKSFVCCPKSYKRKLDAVTNCCEEIVARWPTL